MRFAEMMDALVQDGLRVTDAQIRWAIKTGKVSRPARLSLHRYDFSKEQVAELKEHFALFTPRYWWLPRRRRGCPGFLMAEELNQKVWNMKSERRK